MYTMFLGFLDAPDDGESYAIISNKLLTIHRFLFFCHRGRFSNFQNLFVKKYYLTEREATRVKMLRCAKQRKGTSSSWRSKRRVTRIKLQDTLIYFLKWRRLFSHDVKIWPYVYHFFNCISSKCYGKNF